MKLYLGEKIKKLYGKLNLVPFIIISFFILAIGAFLMIKPIEAQNSANKECLECHGDVGAMSEGPGKKHSIYVNEKKLGGSIHSKLKCVDCHADLKNADFPHDKPKKPQCSGEGCHTNESKQHSESLHGQAIKRGDPLAPDCKFCHGSHEIVAVKDAKSPVSPLKIPFLCGKCHREGSPVQLQRNIPQSHIIENYTESIHGEGLLKKGLAVTATCNSCHSSHFILPHTDPRSTIARNNIAGTCTKCHAKIEDVHQKVINGKLWEKEKHVLPACVDCHEPHKIRKVFYDQGLADKECIKCHENQGIKSTKDGHSLFVNVNEKNNSVHTKVACVQCHSGVQPSHTRPCDNIKKVDCASCHDKIGGDFNMSSHGAAFFRNNKNAPTCSTCHGTHNILHKTDPKSRVFRTNIPNLCSQCHKDTKNMPGTAKQDTSKIKTDYSTSVHGKGLLDLGLIVSATCIDCHSSHKQLPHTDAMASTNKNNIEGTCGNCHFGIQQKFDKSIHSPLVSKTSKRLPTCRDCHLSHTVISTKQDQFRLNIINTCGKCHEEVASSYFETYHGKTSKLGESKSAKCYDCHGSHDILPPDNINSRLSHVNIVGTCKKCHAGANKQFAGYLTHATHHDPVKYPFIFVTFWAMTILLLSVFTVSWGHTLLWLPRSLQMRRKFKAIEEAEGENAVRIQRFSWLDRILHINMVISFLTLALTGMTLKFSYTPLASSIVAFLGGAESAGLFHRFAASLLIIVFITHICELFYKKSKDYKSWKDMLFGPDTMLPTKKDLQDIKGSFKWFIGKGPRPQYGRWTYWEKFDYFAVFWGIFIIGSTGMTLWFPTFFTKILPGPMLNIATIIHSDEALLAAGFIFTVHFFNTHFRPEKFPMDTVVFTGSYDLEEFKEDRPEEYRLLEESGRLEEYIVKPPSKALQLGVKIFGWCALSIGIFIIFWIIYSILASYK